MADILSITASILFFLLAIAYTAGCDRLGTTRGTAIRGTSKGSK